MLNYTIIALMASLVTARYQDFGRPMKSLPLGSLMNLGKIDVSFYINLRPQDMPSKSETHGPAMSSPSDGPCPCSSLRLLKDTTLRSPSEMLGKILSGNDMFSYKEPTTSMLCCDSHENLREDILLEFGPKHSQTVENSHSFPLLPLIFDSIQRPKMPKMPAKNKAVEILFYPKKQGILPIDFERIIGQTSLLKKNGSVKKDAIKIVGDKELINEIKSGQYVPRLPATFKKEVTSHISTRGLREDVTTFNKSNTI